MFLQIYGAAILIILTSVVLGRAICVASGGPQRWWAAPTVGQAFTIILMGASVTLPGNPVTAAVVWVLVVIGAVAFLLKHRPLRVLREDRIRVLREDLTLGALSLFAASVPFLASGQLGVGQGLNDDMEVHLLMAVRADRASA